MHQLLLFCTGGALKSLPRADHTGYCFQVPALPAAPPTAESEVEQAAAIGACRVLEGRGLWRFIQRDWAASRALFLALLASGGRCVALSRF